MDLFYELLRVSIGKSNSLSKAPSGEEWKLMFDTAQRQSLVGVCFSGVKSLEKQKYNPPLELFYEWLAQTTSIQQRNDTMNMRCSELMKMVHNDGREGCILKGQGVACYYPESISSFRQSGDIDLWLSGSRYEVLDWVKSKCGDTDVTNCHVDMSVFKDVEVEVHFRAGSLFNRLKDAGFRKWLDHEKERQLHNLIELPNGEKINTPTIEFNIVFLLAHMHRHFFSEGLGLRQVMDYYFLLVIAHERNVDIGDSIITCNRLGLNSFAEGLMFVMSYVFGMDEKMMPWTPDVMTGKAILSDIEAGGNFGHFDSQRQMTSEASHAIRFGQKAKIGLRNLKHFPSESLWAVIDYVLKFCGK